MWNGVNDGGHPLYNDKKYKVTGQPGIMYPMGTYVDKEYQDKNGYFNVDLAKVTSKDISNMFMYKIKIKNGLGNIGFINQGVYHEKVK